MKELRLVWTSSATATGVAFANTNETVYGIIYDLLAGVEAGSVGVIRLLTSSSLLN